MNEKEREMKLEDVGAAVAAAVARVERNPVCKKLGVYLKWDIWDLRDPRNPRIVSEEILETGAEGAHRRRAEHPLPVEFADFRGRRKAPTVTLNLEAFVEGCHDPQVQEKVEISLEGSALRRLTRANLEGDLSKSAAEAVEKVVAKLFYSEFLQP